MHRLSVLIFMFACGPLALAANLDLPSDQRVPIRANVRECQNYLIPGDQAVDDSVGIPFSSNRLEDFASELQVALQTNPLEKFRNARFFVVGVPMNQASQRQLEFNSYFAATGLSQVGARVVVMSVPTEFVSRESLSLARRILERTAYFFPSLRRDLQQPQVGELTSGFLTSGLTELPNLILLYHRMPPLDAAATITCHVILLSSMLIYEKSLINWLLRSGTKAESTARVEMFMKNMLVSFPFVLNYDVFGHFSEILRFYATHGLTETMVAFPHVATGFAATQGLTMFLQSLFYSQVINSGISKWTNNQVGELNTRTARTLRPWLELPLIVTDSALLGLASSGQAVTLLSLGPLELNSGHAILATVIGAGMTLFWTRPNFLDPTINWYQKIEALIKKMATFRPTPG